MPIEHPRPVSALTARLDPPRGSLRRVEVGQVEVGLVEADDLDPLDLLVQDTHHLARALAVEVEVRRQEDGVRAQLAAPAPRVWRRRPRTRRAS